MGPDGQWQFWCSSKERIELITSLHQGLEANRLGVAAVNGEFW
jgi:hypothetical protein